MVIKSLLYLARELFSEWPAVRSSFQSLHLTELLAPPSVTSILLLAEGDGPARTRSLQPCLLHTHSF